MFYFQSHEGIIELDFCLIKTTAASKSIAEQKQGWALAHNLSKWAKTFTEQRH